MQKIPVGISSCLLGQNVRYDGGHKRDDYIVGTLSRYFDFQPFCPEVGIGLGTPRTPIRLVKKNNEVRCVDLNDSERDLTNRLRDYALQQKQRHQNLCGYILKKGSPSCGMKNVKLYENNVLRREGVGIYSQEMMHCNPLLPVEEEARLGNPWLRENFIQRVYVLYRWKQMISEGLSLSSLVQFHARHKLTIMSHGDYHKLDNMITIIETDNLEKTADQYISLLMNILKKVTLRTQHVKVLQYLHGYLKALLHSDDNAELYQIIEQYHQGKVSLMAPITLLKHHFRKAPNPFIDDSYYMSPYPHELYFSRL